ncbi:hypothetical protein H3L94_03325 [Neisseria shayeganii]|uniref:Uncharacterized protein n=2 Tax=Neisseria shayeganii TaxID=607712 RepID=A0A7D7RNK0_9NEIS|nr:hypothetical protein H3L94_03325 [Neisseria shayeganii]
MARLAGGRRIDYNESAAIRQHLHSKKENMMKKTTVFGLMLLMAAPAAFARDDWLPQAQQMNREIVAKEDRNARQVKMVNGHLGQERLATHQVQLQAGKYYSFFADCDLKCSDIDLKLSRTNGEVIAIDEEPDDSPMFGWRADRTGTYTLTVGMATCEANRCAYSGQVFQGTKDVF